MPDITGITIIPTGDGGNQANRKYTDRIGTDNDCRTSLFDFCSDGRIKIDQPDFATPWFSSQ